MSLYIVIQNKILQIKLMIEWYRYKQKQTGRFHSTVNLLNCILKNGFARGSSYALDRTDGANPPKSVATVTYFKSFYILEGDSSNFLTFFKRATVLMAMGRSRSALPDLDQAIKLNPKFSQVLNHFIIFLIA